MRLEHGKHEQQEVDSLEERKLYCWKLIFQKLGRVTRGQLITHHKEEQTYFTLMLCNEPQSDQYRLFTFIPSKHIKHLCWVNMQTGFLTILTLPSWPVLPLLCVTLYIYNKHHETHDDKNLQNPFWRVANFFCFLSPPSLLSLVVKHTVMLTTQPSLSIFPERPRTCSCWSCNIMTAAASSAPLDRAEG